MTNIPPKKKLKQMSLTNMFEASRTTTESRISNIEDKDDLVKKEQNISCDVDNNQKNTMEKDKCDNSPSQEIDSCITSYPQDKNSIKSCKKKVTWRGSSLSEFVQLNQDNLNVPPVIASPIHEIYIKCPILENSQLNPWPKQYEDVWDSRHVRMPNSSQSLYPDPESKGNGVVQRWSLISRAFESEITSIEELKEAIFSYNIKNRSRWTFAGLKYLVEKEFCEDEQDSFFTSILPGIIKLALSLPHTVCRPIRLLNKHTTRSVTLSQKQIACLLANAFLCTYPRRNAKGPQSEYASYPDINFNRLFHHKEQRGLEKLKCIIHYFKEVVKRPDGIITFTRRSLEHVPVFESSRKVLKRFHIDSKGLIEDAKGFLQVDFANKFVGGGVLGLGCVQEEIRFVLCPELIVTRLFTEVLDRKEALIVTGVEQYSNGRGYASSFEWSGSFNDVTPCDPYRRKLCQLVALDALHFSQNPSQQFSHNLICREIYKAYAGFRPLEGAKGDAIAVASGNWGCGAFKGDPRLKGLIQIIASSMANRDLAYYAFGDEELRDDLSEMHEFLVENGITVGELTMTLTQYGKTTSQVTGSDLLQYIYKNITVYGGDTDSSDNSNPSFLKEKSQIMDKNIRSIKDYFKTTQPSSGNGCSSSIDQSVSVKCTNSTNKKQSLTEEKILSALEECDKLAGGVLKKKIESKCDTVLTIEDDEMEKKITSNALCENLIAPKSDDCSGGLFSMLDKLEK